MRRIFTKCTLTKAAEISFGVKVFFLNELIQEFRLCILAITCKIQRFFPCKTVKNKKGFHIATREKVLFFSLVQGKVGKLRPATTFWAAR